MDEQSTDEAQVFESGVPGEVGSCLWANQICEQPNHHGCKTCLAVEPVRPARPGKRRSEDQEIGR